MAGCADLFSASLSTASDAGLFEPDLGQRLVNVKWSTQLNAGHKTLTANLLARGGSPLHQVGAANAIFRRWRNAILRAYMAGEIVFAGRVWEIQLGPRSYDELGQVVCPVALTVEGLYVDLTHTPAAVPANMTVKGASVSATDLVVQLITAANGVIQPAFYHVDYTGANIGPISPSKQDYPLDLIVNALKAGSEEGEEFAFSIFDPADGPYVRSRTSGTDRWAASIIGTGLGSVWRGEEYCNQVGAVATDGAGSTIAVTPVSSGTGGDLNGGINRERTISVDRAGTQGAQAAIQTYLEAHQDPIAVTGSLRIEPRGQDGVPIIRNGDHGEEPAWRARCGDIVRLEDLLPHDAQLSDNGGQRSWCIESTSFDLTAGTMELKFDQRRVTSRFSETPHRITTLLRAIEPGSSRKLLASYDSGTASIGQAITINTDTLITASTVVFSVNRRTTIHIDIGIELHYQAGAFSADSFQVIVGYILNGETWDNSNSSVEFTSNPYFANNGLNMTFTPHFTRDVDPGDYRVDAMVRVDGTVFTAESVRIRVRG